MNYTLTQLVILLNIQYPLMSHLIKFSLGFMLTLPLWALYVLMCVLCYALYNDRLKCSQGLQQLLQTGLEGFFNPWSIVLYTLLTGYLLQSNTWSEWFMYHQAGHKLGFHLLPFAIIAISFYHSWTKSVQKILKYAKPFADYKKELYPRVFSISRLFGASGILLMTYSFSDEVFQLLQTQLMIGCLISSLGFGIRFYKLWKQPNSLVKRV